MDGRVRHPGRPGAGAPNHTVPGVDGCVTWSRNAVTSFLVAPPGDNHGVPTPLTEGDGPGTHETGHGGP